MRCVGWPSRPAIGSYGGLAAEGDSLFLYDQLRPRIVHVAFDGRHLVVYDRHELASFDAEGVPVACPGGALQSVGSRGAVRRSGGGRAGGCGTADDWGRLARDAGVPDLRQFEECLDAPGTEQELRGTSQSQRKIGVRATPTFVSYGGGRRCRL